MAHKSEDIILVSNQGLFLKEAGEVFKKAGMADLGLLKLCSFSEAVGKIKELHRAFLLLDLREANDSFLPRIEEILLAVGANKVAGVGQPSDVSLLFKLVKIGVKEFINFPFEEKEVKVLLTKWQAQLEAMPVEDRAKVITVYSPKGGSGVTLFVVNLAVALSRRKDDHVAICDLSPQCGDAATYLNLTPQYTVRDLIENQTNLDQSFLDGVMLKHASGVRVLAGPKSDEMPLNADHLNTIKSMLNLLKKSCKFVLIDSGFLNPALLQFVMSESDLILLIGNPDVVSLKGLIVYFNKLKTMHYDEKKIKVLINRYNSKSQIDAKEFEKITKHPISAFLPNNYPACIEAVNTGQPLSERSDMFKKITEIADMIFLSSDGEANAKSSSGSDTDASASGSGKKKVLRCF